MPGPMPPGLMPPQQRVAPPGLGFDPRDLMAQLQAKAAGQQKMGAGAADAGLMPPGGLAASPDGGPAVAALAAGGGFSPGPIPLRQMTDDERATPIDFRGAPMGGMGGLQQPQPGPMPMPQPRAAAPMGGLAARLPQVGQFQKFKMGPMAGLGRSVMAHRQMSRGGFGKPRKPMQLPGY